MIVVMKPGSGPQQVEHVVQLVREMGLKDHVIVGTERTVVAVIGDDRFKDKSRLETVEGVDKVVPILAPYKMASCEMKKERSEIPIGKLGSVGGTKIGVIAGPCSVEDRGQAAGDRARGEGSRRDRPARRRVQAAHVAVRISGFGGRGP
jgi:3-deoxy-7-phosphoheptulonate synthase